MHASFGRAPYFLFIDTEGRDVIEAIENKPGAHGAGVHAAQIVADRGAGAVVTGNVGPNAFRGLTAAGIQVYAGFSGTAGQAVARFVAGDLTPAEGATNPSHQGGLR